MSEKPKRPWFRFHLLTAVLLVITVGLLLWRLFRTRWHHGSFSTNHDSPPVATGWQSTTYGWPFKEAIGFSEEFPSRTQGIHFHLPFVYDLAIWLAILFAVAAISEFLLRRRESRKS